MGHHPIGGNADPNPRFVAEQHGRPRRPRTWASRRSASTTASRSSPRSAPTASACAASTRCRPRTTPARSSPTSFPVAIKGADGAWGLATEDEGRRPETTMEGLAALKTPFRPHGRVTAGNSSPPDRRRHHVAARRRRRGEGARPGPEDAHGRRFAFAGVEPEIMGIGPIPSTEKALAQGGPDDRRHRPVRAERGVRDPGALPARPLRHRRRGPAGQPVGRRDRARPPARRQPACA